MTSDEYRKAISILGMNQVQSAKFFGVNPRTSRNWALGEAPVPAPVKMWLLYMVMKKIKPKAVEQVIEQGLMLMPLL